MMKKIALACLILLAAGCSSDPVSDSMLPENKIENKPPVQEAGKSEQPSATAAQSENAANNILDKLNSTLNAAIGSGDSERIRQASLEILSRDPKNIKALNALAVSYYKNQKPAAAILLLNKVLSQNPNSAEAYNNLGLVYLQKNEKRDAVESFRKALKLDPNNLPAAENLSAIYARAHDYDKVIYVLEGPVKNSTASVEAMNNYAIALSATGKTEEAAGVYAKVLERQADQQQAMLNYSILMIEQQQKYKEGLDLLGRLKFVGTDVESRQIIKDLESKAKAGLK
jgi:cytochrome c-type biogenesis protein CcmH/NrfG